MSIALETSLCSGSTVFGNEGSHKLSDYLISIRDSCLMKIAGGSMKYYNFLIN